MNMLFRLSALCAGMIILTGCTGPDIETIYPESFNVTLTNPSPAARSDAAIRLGVIDILEHHSQFNPQAFVIMDGATELPSQGVDADDDGQVDQLVFVSHFGAHEIKSITVRYAASGARHRKYAPRTQAELSQKVGATLVDGVYTGGKFENVKRSTLPPGHRDHNNFLRYEGPGWESDKVGYRFYLDQRNATDIFGKLTTDMVLQDVGQDGFDSYHESAPWGMDIFQVGESMGVGSIGLWHNGAVEMVANTDSVVSEIISTGPVQSLIRTRYYNWRAGAGVYDLTSELSIIAGSRLTQHSVRISGDGDLILATGLAKHEAGRVVSPHSRGSGAWDYLGLYGKMTMNDENLGIAIVYRQADLNSLAEDEISHLVLLRPAAGQLDYYFLAAWDQEPNGITSLDGFQIYLDRVIAELNSPIEVQYR